MNTKPDLFKEAFVAWIEATGRVMSSQLPSHGENGDGECCFELTGRHERPSDFLQCLLDLLRVTFEPHPFGTFQLNSNWDFVSESIPATPFKLGYLTVTGRPGERVQDLARGQLAQRMEQLGYDFSEASASFISVSSANDRYTLAGNTEVMQAFNAGFGAEEALGAIKSVAGGEPASFVAHKIFAGLARDESLAADTVRISCWLFLSAIEH